MNNYETVIGLEVHVQLSTKSKAFCGCSALFGQKPNSSTCPVCLGMPGVLPVLNREAFTRAIRVAIALNCGIQEKVKFDRKNYYYPDLPKNYQISQYDMPLAFSGYLDLASSGKRIGITRVHLEEDAGKLIHDAKKKLSYVDFNRAGIPLLEIVSEPDIRTPDEAYEYLTSLKAILRYLDVSDCNMEEGSLRCDANISVRKKGERRLGTKVEIKNMNSFKAVQAALVYEKERQGSALKESGGKIVQETRLWDADTLSTASMRSKEETEDYRYFPEPDLVPFVVDQKTIETLKKSLPELPREKMKRFMGQYGLSDKDASCLVTDRAIAAYFEETVRLMNSPKVISNWLTGDIMSELNLKGISIGELNFPPKYLAELLRLVDDGTISGKMAKSLFRESIEKKTSPAELVSASGIRQISDESEIEAIVGKVISGNPRAVQDYKNGKAAALMFLVGQVMRHSNGKANPDLVNRLLIKRLRQLNEK